MECIQSSETAEEEKETKKQLGFHQRQVIAFHSNSGSY